VEVEKNLHSGRTQDERGREGAERRFLGLGHSIAAQAVRLPPAERLAFVRSKIAELRGIYAPTYIADPTCTRQRLLDSLGKWVLRKMGIRERDHGSDNRISSDRQAQDP
jgi:hypothetical protein